MPVPAISPLSSDAYPITFRFLSSEDIPEAISLCRESFPKEYNEECFVYACANPNEFFILGCFGDNGTILGFLLAIYDIETSEWYDPKMPIEEEQLIRDNKFLMSYVCLIAVKSSRKGSGIGSFLMQQFGHSLKKRAPPPSAIYLHVLSANQRAIDFYKNINYKVYCHLPRVTDQDFSGGFYLEIKPVQDHDPGRILVLSSNGSYYNYNGQYHDALILVRSFDDPIEVIAQLDYRNQAAILSSSQNSNNALLEQGEQPRNEWEQKKRKIQYCNVV